MAESTKTISLKEVKEHTKANSCWIVVHDKVYDITKFLEEHPGGEEILLEQAGGYATEAFEDVGHSSDARELMKDYLIGDLAKEDKEKQIFQEKSNPYLTEQNSGSSWSSWLIPLGLAVVAALVYRFVIAPSSS